jgi:hypothetical protein
MSKTSASSEPVYPVGSETKTSEKKEIEKNIDLYDGIFEAIGDIARIIPYGIAKPKRKEIAARIIDD